MIKTPLQWEKVDSHIEGRVFKDGVKPKGDEFSIRLNTVVDGWAGIARAQHRGVYSQHLYPESEVMVQRANKCFINGRVGDVVTTDINKEKMLKFLWGKNMHWNEAIFDSIDWDAIGTCMKKMASKSGMRVINALKLVHGWQNDGQQKELFYEDCQGV